MESDRVARQEAYRKELQEIEDELDHQRRLLKYEAEREEQKKNLQQQRADLESLKDSVKRAEEQKARQKRSANERALRSGKPDSGSPSEERADPGTTKFEWQQLKKLEGAKCPTLDELMDMIGLEDVKAQFLSVKSKVDTILRQNSSLKSERFSCSLLGNPGTGELCILYHL
jgi:DNA repair exonuclease SbcCD ATPase subunit